MTIARVAPIVLVLGAFPSCSETHDHDEVDLTMAEEAATAVEAVAEISELSGTYVENLDEITTDDIEEYVTEALLEIAASLEEAFAGCVTVTDDGATLEATFACEGTNGLFTIDGTATVTVSPTVEDAAIIGAELDSESDLTISGRTLTGATTITYVEDPESAALVADLDLMTSNVGMLTLSAEASIAIDATCAVAEGTITMSAPSGDLTLTVTDFEKCADACPTDGGSISVVAGEHSITLSFDGTSTAHVSTAGGLHGELPLVCE